MSDLSTDQANAAVQEARRAAAVDIWLRLAYLQADCVRRSESYRNAVGRSRWMAKAWGVRMSMDLVARMFGLTDEDVA